MAKKNEEQNEAPKVKVETFTYKVIKPVKISNKVVKVGTTGTRPMADLPLFEKYPKYFKITK